MKRLILMFVFLGFVMLLNAQKNEDIKHDAAASAVNNGSYCYDGIVVDESNQPIAFASVILLSSADSTILNSVVSGNDGSFNVVCHAGKVIAKISFVGYRTIFRLYDHPHLGTVRMEPLSLTIKNVEITGHKPRFEFGKEGLITNVSGSYLSDVGNAENVLSLMPEIKKIHGEISVFGQTKPSLIYIDNKVVRDKSEITNLKSEDIKSIEVIMNPGASYDATVTSVIKIRTVRKPGDGFSGTYYLQDELGVKNKYFGGVKLNYRYKKLDVSTYLAYFDFRSKYEYTNQYLVHDVATISNNAPVYVYNVYKIEGAKFNYTIDNDNSFGIACEFQQRKISNLFIITADHFLSDNSEHHLDVVFDEQRPTRIQDYSGYYSGKLNKLSIDFNVDYLRNRKNYDHLVNISENQNVREIISHTKCHSNLFAAKLVLSHPLFTGNLEFGSECTNTHNHTIFIGKGAKFTDTDDMRKENTVSAFGSYSITWGTFSADAGLRFEHTAVDGYQMGVYQENISPNYSDWYPSLTFTYKPENFLLRFGFTTKTDKPEYDQMANRVQYDDDYVYEGGYSFLRPSIKRSLYLQAKYSWFTLYASYNFNSNSILTCDKKYVDDAVLISFLNYPHYQTINAMLTATHTFGFWSPTYSAGIDRQFFNGEYMGTSKKFRKPVINCVLNNDFKLPYKVDLGVNFNYASKGASSNMILRERSNLSLSMSKMFLHNSLRVVLEVNDILKKDIEAYRYYGKYLDRDYYSYLDHRSVMIIISYNFNATHNNYKGTGAGNEEKGRL
jgi:hypothetical protein